MRSPYRAVRRLEASAVVVYLTFVSLVSAQAPWGPDQVNTTLCLWEQLRVLLAAVIRDTVYLDGGYTWWLPGFENGTYGGVDSDQNPLGIVYTLNFSVPFNTSQNITDLFGTLSKALGGGAANNEAPTYFDGAMLANDAEYYLYGGLLRETAEFDPPYPNEVTCFRAYQYGVQKDGFRPGVLTDRLPSNLTRYLAYGGAASAPSENKAWYFSGMHSPGWGEIFYPGINISKNAVNVSNTLITLDMATQQEETWKNETIPRSIPGRANPELLWVPTGPQGILVAVGGVVYPEFADGSRESSNATASREQSPGFMSTIDIYDVASGDWYRQPASSDGPGALTRGCAVVASAQDHSSFNIYYYGGYDGLRPEEDMNDEVWVLSLPSFRWIKVADGKRDHGRSGHKCVTPYPDQMMVIGGTPGQGGSSLSCVADGIIQLFNLSSAKWMDGYDPAKWSKYAVPEKVYREIGGDGAGGATATAPSPSGWQSTGLSKLFETTYPASKITTYYPYPVSTRSTGTNTTNPEYHDDSNSGSGVPSYLGPVLGSIFGLMFIGLVIVAIIFWRRRRLLRSGTRSEAGTEDSKGNRVISWIRGQYPDNKAPTVTTEDTHVSPDVEPAPASRSPGRQPTHEMADTHIAELMDTSPRAELQDTGLTPVEIIDKHSHFAQNNPSSPLSNPSAYSTNSQGDYNSDVSRHSGTRPSPVSPGGIRPDSPPLGQADAGPLSSHPTAAGPSDPSGSAAARPAVKSGVSEISERDRGHLRQVSDATVSSVATAPGLASGGSIRGARDGSPRFRGAGSSGQLRRSIFYEHEEDLGGKGV